MLEIKVVRGDAPRISQWTEREDRSLAPEPTVWPSSAQQRSAHARGSRGRRCPRCWRPYAPRLTRHTFDEGLTSQGAGHLRDFGETFASQASPSVVIYAVGSMSYKTLVAPDLPRLPSPSSRFSEVSGRKSLRRVHSGLEIWQCRIGVTSLRPGRRDLSDTGRDAARAPVDNKSPPCVQNSFSEARVRARDGRRCWSCVDRSSFVLE